MTHPITRVNNCIETVEHELRGLPRSVDEHDLCVLMAERLTDISSQLSTLIAAIAVLARNGHYVSGSGNVSKVLHIYKFLLKIGFEERSAITFIYEMYGELDKLFDNISTMAKFRHVDLLNRYFDFWEPGVPADQDIVCCGFLPGSPTEEHRLKSACWKFALTYSTNGRTMFRYSRENGVIQIRFLVNGEPGDIQVVRFRDHIPAMVLLRHVHLKEGVEARDKFLLEQGYMLKSPLPQLTSLSVA